MYRVLDMLVFEHGKLNRIGKDYLITISSTVFFTRLQKLVLTYSSPIYSYMEYIHRQKEVLKICKRVSSLSKTLSLS